MRAMVAGNVSAGNPLLNAADGYLKEAPFCPSAAGSVYSYDATSRLTTCPVNTPAGRHGHY